MPIKTFQLFSQKQNPSDTDRRRRVADALLQGNSGNAVAYNTGQGLLLAAKPIIGGILGRLTEENEDKAQQEASDSLIRSLTGGLDTATISSPDAWSGSPSSSGTPSAASSSGWGSGSRSGGSGGSSRAYAASERKDRAVQRLVERGYAPHAAEGVVENLMDESGLNTQAVGDNGTAFGLAQWRGPRFQNLKKFAATQGKDWKDFDTQVDFVDHEMKTGLDEGAKVAYAKLQQAGDKDSAYNAFVQHYERPSQASLQKRLRQTAQATNGIDEAPEAPQFDTSYARQKINSGLAMMRNPRTMEAGFQLYQQGIGEIQALKAKEQEIDYTTRAAIAKDRRARADKQEERDFTLERDELKAQREQGAKTFTLSPGQRVVDAGGNVIAEGAPKPTSEGISLGYDEQGRPVVSMGGSGQKLTETQSKDLLFYERGVNAESDLRPVEDALLDKMGATAEILPGWGRNMVQSNRYQVARRAAKDFLSTILRKESGAAIQDQEMSWYGGIFLPEPGNPPEVLEDKRKARAVALEAIKKGLGPAQVLATVRPDLFDGRSTVPLSLHKDKQPERSQDKAPAAPQGVDPELWKYMTPEERALWQN